MPYSKAEESKSIEVTEVVPFPWWILALAGAVGGIIIVGSVIYSEEERKRERMLLLVRR